MAASVHHIGKAQKKAARRASSHGRNLFREDLPDTGDGGDPIQTGVPPQLDYGPPGGGGTAIQPVSYTAPPGGDTTTTDKGTDEGLSTPVKVAIGVGAGVVLLGGGWLLWRSMKKGRR